MSGCGRKHRAKHLTQQFLDADGWTGPAAGESLAVCVEPPQGQHVRVLLLPAEAAVPVESLVSVPGKFRKVIWLAVKDVIVVANDSTVAFKPSPDHLKTFFRENPEWKLHLENAQNMVESYKRTAVQPSQYAKKTHTTTSVLPKVGSKSPWDDDSAAVEGNGDDKEEDEDEDARGHLNPNRNNIRHRTQFFYDSEEEEDGEMQEE